jgi:hypothetical protein
MGSVLGNAVMTVTNAQALLAGAVTEQSNLAAALGAVVGTAPNASVCSALHASASTSSAALAASNRLEGAPVAAMDRVATAVGAVLSAIDTPSGDQFCAPCALAALELLSRETTAALGAMDDVALVAASAPLLTSVLNGSTAAAAATSAVRTNLALSGTVLSRAESVGAPPVSQEDVVSLQRVLGALGTAARNVEDVSTRADAISGKVVAVGYAATAGTTFLASIAPGSSNGVALFQSTLQVFVSFGSAVSSVLNSPELGSFLTLLDTGAAAVFDIIMDGVRLLQSILAQVDKGLTSVR